MLKEESLSAQMSFLILNSKAWVRNDACISAEYCFDMHICFVLLQRRADEAEKNLVYFLVLFSMSDDSNHPL